MPEIFNPNSGFFISGTNLDSTDRIKWGDVNIGLDRLQFLGSTGISGALTPDIQTNEVFIVDSDGSAVSIGEQIVRLNEDDQIEVSSFSPTRGKFQDVVTVNGSNFYRITDVKFGNKAATFNVLSPTEIEASVPADAGYGRIQVSSTSRSGEAGTSFNTGTSTDFFASRPQINSLSLKSELAGRTIKISGYSLSTVTGVQFPTSNVIKPPINILSDDAGSSLEVEIPTGVSRGQLVLLTQDGRSVTGQNIENQFSHFVKIDSVTPSGVLGGGVASINGENFLSGTLSEDSNGFIKVRFGGVDTSGFKRESSTLITGTVPNTVNTGLNFVSLYSDLGEVYESGKNIFVSGKLAEVSGVNPKFGVTGDFVNITGKNLIGIEKVTLTRADNTGIFYEITGSGITQSTLKNKLEIVIPSGFQTGFASGEGRIEINVKTSGQFGVSNELKSGFLILGKPIIQNVLGLDNIAKEPSSTGTISGLNLLGSSKITIVDSVNTGNLGTLNITGVQMNSTSGQFIKNLFNFPESFNTTGIRLKVTNQGGESNLSEVIKVHKKPAFSGFSPSSGLAGDRVVASGYFSGFKGDGITIGGVAVSNLSLTGSDATGATFLIPSGAASDFFSLTTSGGAEESKSKFSLMPDAPVTTGLSPSPFSPLDYSVFSERQKIDILGSNLNLVDEVIFYDSASEDVTQNTFLSKSESKLSLNLPQNAFSGVVRLKDRFDRTTTGTNEFNLVKFSGASGFYGVFGEEISLSGSFFSGLNASFRNEFGEIVSGTRSSSSNITGNIFSFNTKVPRGITSSKILITGVNNNKLLETDNLFFPLPTISGVSGSSDLDINQEVRITGINSLGSFKSGDAVVGITGAGQNVFYNIDSFSKITGDDGKSASVFSFKVGEEFTGSGQFYIMSPWENYNSGGFNFSTSKTNENINKIITDDFFNIVFPAPAISGISGVGKINDNISGFISGENLKSVTGLFISGSGNNATTGTTNFVNISNTLIRFSSPFASARTTSGFLVVQSERGTATSELSGGLIELINPVAIDSFSPLQGITGSTVNLVGSGFNNASEVTFTTLNSSGSGSFTVNSDSGVSVVVPQFTVSEGQDATITVKGVDTDESTASSRFTIIHDAPTVQFNVVSGRAAPEVGADRSAIFTIVETIDGVDYYVTKMINPDGREIRMNTERV